MPRQTAVRVLLAALCTLHSIQRYTVNAAPGSSRDAHVCSIRVVRCCQHAAISSGGGVGFVGPVCSTGHVRFSATPCCVV